MFVVVLEFLGRSCIHVNTWLCFGRAQGRKENLFFLCSSPLFLSSLRLISGKQGLFLLLPSLQNHLPWLLFCLISVCGTQCSQIQYAAPLIIEGGTIFCCVVLCSYMQHLRCSWHQSQRQQEGSEPALVSKQNSSQVGQLPSVVCCRGGMLDVNVIFLILKSNGYIVLLWSQMQYECECGFVWDFFPKLVLTLVEKLSIWTVPLRTWP